MEAEGPNTCTNAGGSCMLSFDGYYPLSFAMILLGALLSFHFRQAMPELEALPRSKWRAPVNKSN